MLRRLADRYETEDFLRGDPSCFMHRYSSFAERERAAFAASALSYGSRRQFMPRIDYLLSWYMKGGRAVAADDGCFYRLHTNRMVCRFLDVLDGLYADWGTMGEFVKSSGVSTGEGAVKLICSYFASREASDLVPKNPSSACKRVCMFLRWMVRDRSKVDLGLWSGFIDKASLAMPLDTHVLRQARKLGLLSFSSPSMASALALSAVLSEAFPGDPCRGDFALFGLGADPEGAAYGLPSAVPGKGG